MKKKFLFHLLVAMATVALAASPAVTASAKAAKKPSGVKISTSHFPDEEFRKYVKKKFDTNKDGYLSDKELKKAKKIYINYNIWVTNFKGIEYFKYLTEFIYLADEYLDSIKTKPLHLDLTMCKNISSVTISSNNIEKVNLKNCKKLKTVDCSGDGRKKIVKNINISGCTELKKLEIWDTSIKKLDLSKYKKLEDLYIKNADLSSLNLSGCKELQRLYLDDTKIKTLDVSKFKKMRSLLCTNSKISKIDVSKMKNLRELHLSGNRKLKSVDMKNNKKLYWIDLNNTSVDRLDIAKETWKKLASLDVSGTKISRLKLGDCPKLYRIKCSKTKITALNVSKCPNLGELECEKLGLKKLDLTHNPRMSQLYCRGNAFKTLDLSNCKKIKGFGPSSSYRCKVDKDVVVTFAQK